MCLLSKPYVVGEILNNFRDMQKPATCSHAILRKLDVYSLWRDKGRRNEPGETVRNMYPTELK